MKEEGEEEIEKLQLRDDLELFNWIEWDVRMYGRWLDLTDFFGFFTEF